MKNKIGRFCMILGAVLIISAASLFIYNHYEEKRAEQSSLYLVSQIIELIKEKESSGQCDSLENQPLSTPIEFLDEDTLEMLEVEIDGNAYIGYLSIPKLELELPIMADWDYKSLQISPCRYAGSVRGEDLVIMAHNYKKHFGDLSTLEEGDRIVFTDMNGVATVYQVVAKDVLNPNAVEEMTAGVFDLTMFTCTYGGKSRVTVLCNRI
jgi:sortase A